MGGLVNVDVGSILGGIGTLAKDIRQAITGKDPEMEKRLLELEAMASKGQMDINLAEAQNPNLFVSGWRPAVGWCCVLSLMWYYFIAPILIYFNIGGTLPQFEAGELMTLLMGLLGIGGLRTFEKYHGVSR